MKSKDFITGEIYSNKQISETFKVSLMRGMARSNKKTGTDSLVLISKHVADSKNRNPYEDKWIEGKLHYTGEGRIGNQLLTSGQNKTLANSNGDSIIVYLFEVLEQGEYIYRGVVELRDEPYTVYELDSNGDDRKVWKFPLTVVTAESVTDKSLIQRIEQKKKKITSQIEKDELERLAKQASRSNKESYSRSKGKNKVYREVTSKSFERNPYIAQYVKNISQGLCGLCEQLAPFKDKQGKPFLHSHHIDYLSDGGADTIENSIAICPNCHAKIHILEDVVTKNLLLKKVAEREQKISK